MKNTKLTLYFILACSSLLLFSSSCKHKPFGFNGKENAEQAFNKCIKLASQKKFKDSIDCLEIFKSRFPEAPEAKDADLRIADAYFQKKEYLLAAESYQVFAKAQPLHPKLDYAYYRLGLSKFYQTPKKIDRDQASLPDSLSAFEIVFTQFPSSPYAKMAKLKYDESKLLIAKRIFYVGRFYYRYGEYKSAIPRLKEVIENYANLGLDEETFTLLIKSHLALEEKEEAKLYAQLMKEKLPQNVKAQKFAEKILKNN